MKNHQTKSTIYQRLLERAKNRLRITAKKTNFIDISNLKMVRVKKAEIDEKVINPNKENQQNVFKENVYALRRMIGVLRADNSKRLLSILLDLHELAEQVAKDEAISLRDWDYHSYSSYIAIHSAGFIDVYDSSSDIKQYYGMIIAAEALTAMANINDESIPTIGQFIYQLHSSLNKIIEEQTKSQQPIALQQTDRGGFANHL